MIVLSSLSHRLAIAVSSQFHRLIILILIALILVLVDVGGIDNIKPYCCFSLNTWAEKISIFVALSFHAPSGNPALRQV